MARDNYLIIGSKKIYIVAWLDLNYYEQETNVLLDALKTLNVNQEKTLEEEKVKLNQSLRKIEALSVEIRDQEQHYDFEWEWQDMIVQKLELQQRYSIVVSAFSFSEGRLSSLCKLIENEFNFKLKLKDIRNNSDILMYKTYLEKVFELNFSKMEPYFTPINQQKSIRNKIIHNEGVATEEDREKIKGIDGIQIKDVMGEMKFVINKNLYVDYLLGKMKSFFKELIIAVDTRAEELMTEVN